ncbi:hypothetical protein [Planctomycetes bacterium K23_9]|uniref:Uncharacterized protein n=1 Tax=Stieleria marina TaxID=1930275 RepID=A0A517NPH1_9BACT|nr:hypothetical protein K239x_09590 [Planctomycetes bacterium K23_9]
MNDDPLVLRIESSLRALRTFGGYQELQKRGISLSVTKRVTPGTDISCVKQTTTSFSTLPSEIVLVVGLLNDR